jgi:hypothetical protein
MFSLGNVAEKEASREGDSLEVQAFEVTPDQEGWA